MKHLEFKLAHHWNGVCECRDGGIPRPQCATIYPTEYCNLGCVYCHSRDLHSGGHMNAELYRNTINDLCSFGVQAIAFEGGGEPMLHPCIEQFISIANALDMRVGVLTNGTIFSSALLECSWVRVSLDVPDKDAYNRIKRPSDPNAFFRVVDNLQRLVDRKRAHGWPVTIGIKFMLSTEWEDVQACWALANHIGVDRVDIKHVRNHDISLTDHAQDIGGHCGITPLRAVIDCDGTYYACPFFHHHKDMEIGSGPIADFWGGERHREVIRAIDGRVCSLYDCGLRNVERHYPTLESAHVEFI